MKFTLQNIRQKVSRSAAVLFLLWSGIPIAFIYVRLLSMTVVEGKSLVSVPDLLIILAPSVGAYFLGVLVLRIFAKPVPDGDTWAKWIRMASLCVFAMAVGVVAPFFEWAWEG